MKIQNSERLSFRLMNSEDAELFFQLDQDPEVMHFINGGAVTSMEEIKEVYLPRMEKYTNEKEGWGIWKTSLKDSGEYLGWILVRPMDFFNENQQLDNLELGWRFARNCWGKGYATEAAENIKQALIAQGNIKKLCAIAVEENYGSVSIMKKLGMNYIKTYLHRDPIFTDTVVYYEMDVV